MHVFMAQYTIISCPHLLSGAPCLQGSEQRSAPLHQQAHLPGVRGEDHRHHTLGQVDPAGDRRDQGGNGEGD